MKKYTVTYTTKDKAISSTFTRNYPEPLDIALQSMDPRDFEDPAVRDAGAEALTEAPVFLNLYWAAFRQWLVSDRSTAKRLRVGNDSNAPLSEEEVSKHFLTAKMPKYGETREAIPAEEKAAKVADEAIEKMTEAQLIELEQKLAERIAAARAKQAGAQG